MLRKLHIGGQTPAPGWEIMDILPGPHVDHLGNAGDLSRFPDNSLDEIYASHTLEHFDYRFELRRRSGNGIGP
jgi:predicted SAM-dependent methyltransferase